jgi:P27 family predicted phage terminase small subunit
VALKPLGAPAHLAAETQEWWRSVVARWDLDPHHVRLLTLAAESWDRGQQARELIAREGLTMTTAAGLRAHPAVRIELDSRTSFSRLLRELDLDIEAPVAARRPPSLRSVAR